VERPGYRTFELGCLYGLIPGDGEGNLRCMIHKALGNH
jgi:hypothetical protein